MKSKTNFWIKVTLCFISFDLFADSAIVPLFTAIFTEFPNATTFQKNFIISGNAMFGILSSFITGILIHYISKKYLILVGAFLYAIGGGAGIFTFSLNYLILVRIFTGTSIGILSTVALSLIAELIKDDKERGTLNGVYNAVSAAFGIIASLLAGFIAIYSWRAAFLINDIYIVSFILVMKYIPLTPPEKKQVEKTTHKNKAASFIYGSTIFTLFCFFVYNIFFDEVYYLIDFIVEEKGIGNSVLSGLISSCMTFCTFVGGILFGILYAKVKKQLPILFYAGTAIGLIGMNYVNNVFLIAVMAALIGISYPLAISYFATVIQKMSSKNNGVLMSIYMIEMSIAAFSSSYVPMLVNTLFHTATISQSYFYTGVLAVAFGIVYYLVSIKNNTLNHIIFTEKNIVKEVA